ncbi:MAG: octaprenyl diphosphate synthase [Brachymonas sp.]|nr:octaprenyl diphosphate synthase [Brachymonas sp.]
MLQVDSVIHTRLQSDVPLVARISQYIIAAGGKRIRPVLLLLLSGALGQKDARKYKLAAIVEFIHTATLLHDDVVDESTLRRGQPTANESFGNAASVLVGDFLYSRAFQMMVECKSMKIMQILSEATNIIAEGEVLQLMNMHDASLDQVTYLRVIRSKTAKLFEATARIAAVLADSDAKTEEACAQFGQALGTAFQIRDDALDYDGQQNELGKNLGDDLREGKVTLPLIIAIERANTQDAQFLRQTIEQPDSNHLDHALDRVKQIIQSTKALDATHDLAAHEAQRACAALDHFEPSDFLLALRQLADQSIQRKS